MPGCSHYLSKFQFAVAEWMANITVGSILAYGVFKTLS